MVADYNVIRERLAGESLDLGRLRAELTATKSRLAQKRKEVWARMPFSESFCAEMSQLWQIRAERARLRNAIKRCKRTIRGLSERIAEIGYGEYQAMFSNDEDDDADVDDEEFSDTGRIEQFVE